MSFNDRKPFGYTIFCDDIRNEEGQKRSLIGVYAGDIKFSGAFPLVLGKFGLVVQYFEPAGPDVTPPKTLSLAIYLPGDPDDKPSITGEISPEALSSQAVDAQFAGATVNIILSPFEIKQEGTIRVRLNRDGEVHKLGGLRVIQEKPAPKT